MKRIHVSGLDNLTSIDLLRHAGNQTFVSSLESHAGFNISAAVDIAVKSIEGGFFRGDPLHESFHIYVNSSAVSMMGNVLLAIERGQFDMVDVGDIIAAIDAARNHNFTQLACVLEPLNFARVSDIVAHLDVIGIQLVPDLKNATKLRDQL